MTGDWWSNTVTYGSGLYHSIGSDIPSSAKIHLYTVGSQTRNYHFVDKRMFPNMILGNYWNNADTSNPAQCGLHYSGDDSGIGINYKGSSNSMLYLIIGDNSISAEGSLILHFAIIIALVMRINLLG